MTLVRTQDPKTEKTERTIAPIYGERTEVREMVDRLRAGLPNASKIPDRGLIALATAALAHDLDPWNGEIYVGYDDKKDETFLIPGIKGKRKGAKRQLEQGHFIDPRFVIVPEEEWRLYANEKDTYNQPIERIHLCYLRRTDAVAKYIDLLDKAFKVTQSYEEARKLIGDPPIYMGVGIVRIGEKSKMERGALANKRAESEALSRGFDLPFADRAPDGAIIGGYAEDDDVIEGQATEVKEQEKKSEPPQDPQPPAEAEPTTEATEPAQSEEQPEPEQSAPAAAEPVTAEPEKPAKAAPAKASQPKTKEEKDAERTKTIEAMRRSSPPTIVVAVEWLHKNLGFDILPGKLSIVLKEKLGKDFELSNPLPPKVWHAAIDLALNSQAGA